MSEQIAVRLPDELARALGAIVAKGAFPSKADAVRVAIERLLDQERRDEIGRAIVDGYGRNPQTDEEYAIARASALRAIREEPW